MKLSLLLICCLLLAACDRKEDPKDPTRSPLSTLPAEPEKPEADKKIMVYMGQSNMPALLNGQDLLLDEIKKYKSTDNVQAIYCSQGGTSASQWVKGTPLYNDCLEKIKSHKGQVWALLYMQGENEAQNCTPWKVHFESIVRDLKADTDSPNMASAWERINIAFDPSATCLAQVRNEQETANVYGHYVDMDGIPMNADGVHYATHPEIGQRFGKTIAPYLN